jgi:hypothetical protein
MKDEIIETTGSCIVLNLLDSFSSQENGNQLLASSNNNQSNVTPEMLASYSVEPAAYNFITDDPEHNADIASSIDEAVIISRDSFEGVFHMKLSL